MKPPQPTPATSHRQTRLLLWIGFGGLLLLLLVFGLSAISFLHQIQARQERIREDYIRRDSALESLRSLIYLSGTYARDYLIDEGAPSAASDRARFLATQSAIEAAMNRYRAIPSAAAREPFRHLEVELADYFAGVHQALAWTTAQRRDLASAAIQNRILPERALAVGLIDRVQALDQTDLKTNSQTVSEMFASFRDKLLGLLILTTGIGLLLAGASMWRLLQLETASAASFREILRTREELKQLSGELVSAQESERRRISRELHDEVGQVLSATMLVLGNLRSSIRDGNRDEAGRQIHMIEEMTERNASVVRNLSLLLRPAMLDDIGLIPALKWLGREVSRAHRIQVEVTADNFPENLPDEHRTCIFRVAQEALRNACRHSGASRVEISVRESGGRVMVEVRDDGKGFDPATETGMGSLGMEERVVRLGGDFTIRSERGHGAAVCVQLPLPELSGAMLGSDRAFPEPSAPALL